jgi:hypothetical protein
MLMKSEAIGPAADRIHPGWVRWIRAGQASMDDTYGGRDLRGTGVPRLRAADKPAGGDID